MSWNHGLFKNQKGVFLVFTAILLPIIFACAGLAMDLGNAFAHKSKLQNAADAAVLVYATLCQTDEISAKEQTVKYMDANMHGESYRDLYGMIRKKNDKNIVSLYVKQDVPTTFMRILNINNVTVEAEATCNIPSIVPPREAGVFNYAFIGAANDSSPALWFQSDKNKIIGDVHSNGRVQFSYSVTAGTADRCVLVDGDFTTALQNDVALWGDPLIINQNWHDNEPIRFKDAIPFPDNVSDPSDPKYRDNKYWYYSTFGIDNGTSYGRDILAAEAYDKTIGNNGNLDISLNKDSRDTGAIYNFIEKYKAKYPTWKDPEYNYKPEEWVTTEPGKGFADYYEGHKYSIIIADGDINLYPKYIDWDADHLTIISLHGNVKISYNGSDCPDKLKALIYAPNGEISCDASYKTFEGSMVAQHIVSPSTGATYIWNNFGFGNGGTGGSSGGTGSGEVLNEPIKLQPDPDDNESGSKITF